VNEASYDEESFQVAIEFQTSIVWPYQVDIIPHFGSWKKSPDNHEQGLKSAVLPFIYLLFICFILLFHGYKHYLFRTN
jgi:hypothetical protein